MKFLLSTFSVCFFVSFSSFANVIKVDTPFGPMFRPEDNKTYPGVLVLHGSEGGGRAFSQLEAQYLASQGFVALAPCYFACFEGNASMAKPQAEFFDINSNLVYEAFKWLKTSAHTQGEKLAIYGTSKGAELTFLLAAITTKFKLAAPDVIAAHAVTDVAEVGFSWKWYLPECWEADENGTVPRWKAECGNGPAPLEEYGPKGANGCVASPEKPHHSFTYQSWKWNGSYEEIKTHGQIELERFSGPIFFTHGTADELWCVSKAIAMEKHLKAHGRSPEVHYFPGEKHVFSALAENRRKKLLLRFLLKHLR